MAGQAKKSRKNSEENLGEKNLGEKKSQKKNARGADPGEKSGNSRGKKSGEVLKKTGETDGSVEISGKNFSENSQKKIGTKNSGKNSERN